ncbi:MAG: response regulator [Candidatus Tectimicrobiota bacterium]
MTPSDVPSQASAPHRILLVDDHPIVREGLRQLIHRQADLVVCGEASSVSEALEAITTLQPGLVLLDVSLYSSSGLDLIQHLSQYLPMLPILVMSMHDEELYADRVIRAGARGYIMKQEPTEQMLAAIYRVLQGQIYTSKHMQARIIRHYFGGSPETAPASPLARLSDRELEIFRLFGQGINRHQIATALHLSVKTVETHRAHIMEKLQLKSVTDLIRYAVHWLGETGAS